MNQWRRFQFFEERSASSGLSEDLRRSISCITGGRGAICLGTDEGLVHVADRWLSVRLSFLAHTGPVLAIHQLKQRNILVTVGNEASEDQSSSTTSLKLWDLDRRDEHDSPACARAFDVFSSRFPASKVTTVAALEASSFNLLIAIGLASGAVDLLRTDSKHINRIRLPSDSTLPPPSSSSSSYASQAAALSRLSVTGLGFRSDPDSSAVHLFVVSDGGVSTFPLSNISSSSQPARHLMAPLGAPAKCVTMSNTQDLVVARQEAFYFYNSEGPGPCYALDCEKRAVAWARECLVCVHVDPRKGDRTVLSIYDVRNKLIAHSGVVAGELQHLVCEGPCVVLLMKDGPPLILQERDTQSKLQALFKKSLYGLALSLVQASKVDVSVMTDVLRKYGDHLFEMRDFDGAVAQYIRTIGQLEPSYVIQKFLSAQRIHNLTHYLESLQQRGAAGPDHTTLLLSCYARLKDVDRLDAFLRATAPPPDPALPPAPGTANTSATGAGIAEGGQTGPGGGESAQESKGGKQGPAEASRDEATARGTPGAGPSGQGTTGGMPVAGGRTGGGREGKGAAEGLRDGTGREAGGSDRHSGEGEGRGGAGGEGVNRDERGGEQGGLGGTVGQWREPHEFPFDAPSAIWICQAAGYEEQALFVARHAGLHALALGIMFGQLEKFCEGLQYLARLPLDDKLAALDRYGPALVAHCPDAVTSLLLELCSTAKPPNGAPPVHAGERPHHKQLASGGRVGRGTEAEGEGVVASPMAFASLYVDHPASLVGFLEQFLGRDPESPWRSEVLNALLDLYLALSWESEVGSEREEERKGERGGGKAAPTESGRGGNGGAAEASTSGTRGGGKQGQSAAGTPVEGSRDWYLAKAGRLLREGWGQQGSDPSYDPEQAVLSCQMHGFREGLLFLLERLRMYKEVVASYMKDNDLKGLIACCKRLGDPSRGGDPSLWADVLVFFGAHREACEEEVAEVLGVVEREALLPPLIVLQALSQNKGITAGVVKDYVARQLAKDTAAIEEDRKAIHRYQEETKRYQAELLELETKAKVFQVQKCTACSTALDLPAVHFLCMHSFHLRCMGDNESECPLCTPANRTVLEMQKSLQKSANNQDRFFQELHDANDGFSVIAEYFGRNMMNQGRPEGKGAASQGVSQDMLALLSHDMSLQGI